MREIPRPPDAAPALLAAAAACSSAEESSPPLASSPAVAVNARQCIPPPPLPPAAVAAAPEPALTTELMEPWRRKSMKGILYSWPPTRGSASGQSHRHHGLSLVNLNRLSVTSIADGTSHVHGMQLWQQSSILAQGVVMSHQGSTRAAPGQHQGSTRAAQGQHKGSTRAAPGQQQGSSRAASGQHQGSTRAAQGQHQGSTRAAQGQQQQGSIGKWATTCMAALQDPHSSPFHDSPQLPTARCKWVRQP